MGLKTVNFFTTIGNRTNGGTNGVNVQSSRIPLLKHQKNLIDKYYQKFIDTNHLNIELLFKSY